VMADRIARGREPPPRRRLIATGTSKAWSTGEVAWVDGMEQKAALFLAQAEPGDRILMPHPWETKFPPQARQALEAKKVSLAFLKRVPV
jgi:hypothetical protein